MVGHVEETLWREPLQGGRARGTGPRDAYSCTLIGRDRYALITASLGEAAFEHQDGCLCAAVLPPTASEDLARPEMTS